MNNIVNDFGCYDIAWHICDNFKKINEGNNYVESIADQVGKLLNINGKSMIESFVSSDRKFVIDLINSHLNSLEDLKNQDKVRFLKMSIVTYMYEKRKIGEYASFVDSALASEYNNIIAKMSLSDIPKDKEMAAKRMIYNDICYAVAICVKDINEKIAQCSGMDLSSPLPEKIHAIIGKYIQEALNANINKLTNISINSLDSTIVQISELIKVFVCEKIEKTDYEVKAYNTENLRQRESLLNSREIEIEKKELKLEELIKKNMSFSLDLQKKASDIDLKIDELAFKKSEFEDLVKNVVNMCKKIISIAENK